MNSKILGLLAIAAIPAIAFGAPQLRLSSAVVGPLRVPVGANPAPQTIYAYNAGDGSIAPAVSSNRSWLTAQVQAASACSFDGGTCRPIAISMSSAELSSGTYTGTITVNDPNAYDAPQSITVTVSVGSVVPAKLDFYLPPNGGQATSSFATTSEVQTPVSTTSGGNWLSVALDPGGTFRTSYPYTVSARYLNGMAEGTYNGQIQVSGSPVAGDNHAVPVAFHVTSAPIQSLSQNDIDLRVSQNHAMDVVINVMGTGTSAPEISGVTVEMQNGDAWLSAEQVEGVAQVKVTLTAGTLDQGVYEGTVTIASNAANGPGVVPVTMEVIPEGPPLVTYNRVVNNATFTGGEKLSPGDVSAVFGEGFTYGDPASAAEVPLPESIDDVSVNINGQPVPLWYVSYGQINFQVPYGTPSGQATVSVSRNGTPGNTVTVQIQPRSPRILLLGREEYGVVTFADYITFPISAAYASSFEAAGFHVRKAKAGDALILWCIGFGQTVPAATTGDAAPSQEPLARLADVPTVTFDGGTIFNPAATARPIYAGLSPGFAGLYQINFIVPSNVPKGDAIGLRVVLPSGIASNRITIATE